MVFWLVRVTEAPSTGRPWGSTTVPEMELVAVCAQPVGQAVKKAKRRSNATSRPEIVERIPNFFFLLGVNVGVLLRKLGRTTGMLKSPNRIGSS